MADNANVQQGASNGHSVWQDPNETSNPKEPKVGPKGVSASDAVEMSVANAEARAKVQEDERKAFAKSQAQNGPVLSDEETKAQAKEIADKEKAASAKKAADAKSDAKDDSKK